MPRTSLRRTHLALIVSAALVTGCGPSVEGYVDDPEERRAVLAQCATLEINPRQDERCSMAAEAEGIAARNAIDGLLNGD